MKITSKISFAIVGVICLSVASIASAQVNDELTKQQEDARLYLEMIDILKDAPQADQLAGWEKFLKEHPDSYFRDEIQNNLASMRARQKIIEREREEADSKRYFKTIEQAAKLKAAEQIMLWEKFLRENPESFFANEARTTLNRLKEEKKFGTTPTGKAKPTASKPSAVKPAAPVLIAPAAKPAKPPKVTELTPAKVEEDFDEGRLDPDRALFLAAVPGFVVPGLGHFYAKRYAMGAFLAAIRVTGLALVGIGAYREINELVIPGALLAVISYGLDVFMAPIEARNYNETLEPLPPLEDSKVPQSFRELDAPNLVIAWRFQF